MSEDWDLFAVVRSCSSSVSTTNSCSVRQQDPPPRPTLFPQDFYKPFFPVTTTTWFSSVPPNVVVKQEQEQELELPESQDKKPLLGVRVFTPSTSSSSSSSVFVFRSQRDQIIQQQSHAPLRSKKRKNEQKRTICHVTQENLSCDMWAWRKYGQKPIKGSPYPRNYYRCSSSKGCLARKQVERSNLDPNIFILTYTGEHTHPRPTHRNSLAGSTRIKSQPVNPIPKPDSSVQTFPRSNTVKKENNLSPKTPLKENGDDGVNMEAEEFDEVEEEDDDDVDDLLIPNFTVRDRDELFFSVNFSSLSAGDGGG